MDDIAIQNKVYTQEKTPGFLNMAGAVANPLAAFRVGPSRRRNVKRIWAHATIRARCDQLEVRSFRSKHPEEVFTVTLVGEELKSYKSDSKMAFNKKSTNKTGLKGLL